MESKTDDALKTRFLVVRKEIYNRYTVKQLNEHQTASVTLKRSMTERERKSEVIEIATDITHHRSGCKQADQPHSDGLIDQEVLS